MISPKHPSAVISKVRVIFLHQVWLLLFKSWNVLEGGAWLPPQAFILSKLARHIVAKFMCFLPTAVECPLSNFLDRPQRAVAILFPGSMKIDMCKLQFWWLQKSSSALPPCPSSSSYHSGEGQAYADGPPLVFSFSCFLLPCKQWPHSGSPL